MVFAIMNNLFVDVILGKDFMHKHESVTFKFGKEEDALYLRTEDDDSVLRQGFHLPIIIRGILYIIYPH